jgi:peptide/nickel transport system ATP-binding protein
MTMLSADALLEVRGLKTWFPIRSGVLRRVRGQVRAVDGVDLTIYPGETLALVGESGCGKTTVGRSLLRLVEPTGGNIWFGGVNLSRLSLKAFKPYRQKIQIVMQDPGAALDPRLTVRDAIAEGMEAFGLGASGAERTERVADLMRRVSLDPELMWRYPHEFSGGQRQRISIARALAVEPALLVCDEATSALDVSIQAQILNLLSELKAERRLTYLFITHDLGVVRYFADRVAVMYLGRIVELGRTERVFAAPQHPYTQALLASVPSLDPDRRGVEPMALGDVPSPISPPSGCHFHPRCRVRLPSCSTCDPPVVPLPDGLSRCVLAERCADGKPARADTGVAAALPPQEKAGATRLEPSP